MKQMEVTNFAKREHSISVTSVKTYLCLLQVVSSGSTLSAMVYVLFCWAKRIKIRTCEKNTFGCEHQEKTQINLCIRIV